MVNRNKNRGDRMECRIGTGSNQSASALIPSDVAFYPFNLAEPCAYIRLNPDKSDNLHPDGNYHELAICSFLH